MSIFNIMARVESMLKDDAMIFDKGDLDALETQITTASSSISERRKVLAEQVAEAVVPEIGIDFADSLFFTLYPDAKYTPRRNFDKHMQIETLGKAPFDPVSDSVDVCRYCYSELHDENPLKHTSTCSWLHAHMLMLKNFPSWYAAHLRTL